MNGVWLRFAAASVAFGLLSGCTGDGEPDVTARDAAIYRSVIVDMVDRSGVVLVATEDLPVLYLEALGQDGIPLQVQAEVVGEFVEQYEIRFIDHLEEAVDPDLPDLPVRADGLLIGLGDIGIDGGIDADGDAEIDGDLDGAAEVHSELYLHAGDIRGFNYTLRRTGDQHWTVVGTPVDVEPEVLVPKP